MGRFINADSYTSTGQGILGHNMFAYCRSNPSCRVDISGTADQDAFDTDGDVLEDDEILGSKGGGGSFDPYQAVLDRTYASQHGGTSKGFSSFNQLKAYTGSPGEGNQWHHIVEQNQTGKSGFCAESVNNTSNVIALDATTHQQISGFYSSKQTFTEGMTVRNWLAGQSFEFQFNFGVEQLAKIIFGGE